MKLIDLTHPISPKMPVYPGMEPPVFITGCSIDDTGWSQYWGTEQYFSDYPVLSLEAADWLSRFGLRGFGLDTISADEADSQDFPVHKAFLRNDMIIIENLTNLEKLPCSRFLFSCFPLNFEDADGSPVRAVAFIE